MASSRPSLLPVADPEARERRIAGSLFFATCCSVFLVYLFQWGPEATPERGWHALLFTAVLMLILLAHEMGHYVVARLHGFRLSLPWFLPVPFLVGTLGAVIGLRDLPRRRADLLEMGAAGPLAGLAVIAVASVVWLWTGPWGTVFPGDLELSRPPLLWLLSWVGTGGAPPAIATSDPLGFAIWIGCLVTAMNLVPMGQLDGGHVVGALFPGAARRIGQVALVVLLVAGLVWPGWALWAVLLHFLGAREPLQLRRARDVPGSRPRLVALAALAAFLLCFTPVPIGW